MRGREDLVAVPGEQRLVGGDDVLAVGDRLQDERPRRLDTADQLDDDVDVRMRKDERRVIGQVDAGDAARQLAGAGQRLFRDPRDADRPTRAARDFLFVAAEHGPGAEPDRAEPEEADLQRFHLRVRHRRLYPIPSSRNICLMPRTACRVRSLFSISAKRTWPSPYSPKPMPGDTETLARSIRRFANSSEPAGR